jgi:LemA protein
MIVIAILAALGLAAAIVALLIRSRLTRLAAQSESAWSNIEVLLKVRHDLVPNLVETVREYAAD